MKKLVRNYPKIAEKIRSNKSKRSDIKYFLTIDFLTKTTKKCANFVHILLVLNFIKYFVLIFQIRTVQWLNCTNQIDELNCSYNGGGVVYLLQSVAIHFNLLQYRFKAVCFATRRHCTSAYAWLSDTLGPKFWRNRQWHSWKKKRVERKVVFTNPRTPLYWYYN